MFYCDVNYVHLNTYAEIVSVQLDRFDSPLHPRNYYVKQDWKTFIAPGSSFLPLLCQSILPPPNLATFWLLSAWSSCICFGPSYKSYSAVYILLCLPSFAQPNGFKIHSYCCLYQWFIPFSLLSSISIVWIYHSLSLSLLMDKWSSLFSVFAYFVQGC